MIDEHEARGHIPHRTWCKACMKGRMRGERHPERVGEEATLPHISMDYCFLRDSPGDKAVTVLVLKDQKTKM